MYTLICLLIFCAFYLRYLESKKLNKATVNKNVGLIAQNAPVCNGLCALLFMTGLLACIYVFGVGSGTFAVLFIAMGMGSLIVLLNPFVYLKLPHIIGLFVVFLCMELFIY